MCNRLFTIPCVFIDAYTTTCVCVCMMYVLHVCVCMMYVLQVCVHDVCTTCCVCMMYIRQRLHIQCVYSALVYSVHKHPQTHTHLGNITEASQQHSLNRPICIPVICLTVVCVCVYVCIPLHTLHAHGYCHTTHTPTHPPTHTHTPTHTYRNRSPGITNALGTGTSVCLSGSSVTLGAICVCRGGCGECVEEDVRECVYQR